MKRQILKRKMIADKTGRGESISSAGLRSYIFNKEKPYWFFLFDACDESSFFSDPNRRFYLTLLFNKGISDKGRCGRSFFDPVPALCYTLKESGTDALPV